MTGKLAGAFVVVVACGDGAARAGRLAYVLQANGARAVVFAPEDETEDETAVVEMVAELARTPDPQ